MNERRTWLAALLLSMPIAACDSGSGDFDHLSSSSGAATVTDLMPTCAPANPSLPVVAPSLVIEPKTVFLWPPNHKFHTISVADCIQVAGVCDPGISAQFIWGSSDEPVDSIGDGHFAPDILFGGCDEVQVRSERQGPKNGRVYKLGVRVIDSAGNATDSSCEVIVDHDQRGVDGADSGESYRVYPTNASTGLVCDGRRPVEPPVVPPVVVRTPDAGSLPIGI